MGSEHEYVATQLNLVFDEADDCISAEMVSFLDHRYTANILEFQAEYSNGDKLWHPLDLATDEDPHSKKQYTSRL